MSSPAITNYIYEKVALRSPRGKNQSVIQYCFFCFLCVCFMFILSKLLLLGDFPILTFFIIIIFKVRINPDLGCGFV